MEAERSQKAGLTRSFSATAFIPKTRAILKPTSDVVVYALSHRAWRDLSGTGCVGRAAGATAFQRVSRNRVRELSNTAEREPED